MCPLRTPSQAIPYLGDSCNVGECRVDICGYPFRDNGFRRSGLKCRPRVRGREFNPRPEKSRESTKSGNRPEV
jgi:hypothetical protein